jgi:hypothetical protein
MDRHRSKVRALESRRQEILRAQRVLDQRAKMREESNVAFNGMRSKRRAAEAVKYQAEALEAKARNKALLTQVQDETQQLLSNLTPEGLPLVPSIVAEQLKAERDRYFQTLVVATESWRSESAARLALQQAQLSALSLQAEDAEKKANEAEALFHEEKAVALAAHVSNLSIGSRKRDEILEEVQAFSLNKSFSVSFIDLKIHVLIIQRLSGWKSCAMSMQRVQPPKLVKHLSETWPNKNETLHKLWKLRKLMSVMAIAFTSVMAIAFTSVTIRVAAAATSAPVRIHLTVMDKLQIVLCLQHLFCITLSRTVVL